MSNEINNIWQNEEHGSYGSRRLHRIAFLSERQNCRAEMLRQAEMLFRGKHREYFLCENRTEFNFPEMEVQDRVIRPYATLKMLTLTSVKTADLMFGEKARLSCDNQVKRQRLDDLAKRSLVHARFHAAAVQASWAGGSFLISCRWRGKVYICNVPPREMFPVGELQPDGQYESYERYQVASIGAGDACIHLLLVTHYQRATIDRRVYQLARDNTIVREVDITLWPEPFAKTEPTGLGENVVTYIPNELEGQLGISDYDGLIGAQDAINSALTQIYRILSQHSDPLIALPAELFDEDGNIRLNKFRAFKYSDPNAIPKYVVNPASLDSAMKDRVFRLTAFCIEGEIAQVLLGIKEGAAPDAARKLRLECAAMLAKVRRKTLTIEPAVQRSLEVALMLEGSAPGAVLLSSDPVGVDPHDGLPIDELDEAEIVSSYRSSSSMSLEDAVSRRVPDPDAAAVEVARIRAEQTAGTPNVLLNDPGAIAPAQTDPAALNGSVSV